MQVSLFKILSFADGRDRLRTKEEVIRLIKDMPNNVTTEDIIKELYAKLKLDRELQKMEDEGTHANNVGAGKTGKWLH